jgi:hypothetical protein
MNQPQVSPDERTPYERAKQLAAQGLSGTDVLTLLRQRFSNRKRPMIPIT